MIFFRKENYPHLEPSEDDSSSKKVTLMESLQVFKDGYFWILIFSFFSGIGSAVFVLTQAEQIWKNYNHSPNLEHWGDTLLLVFSFANAGGNAVCGVASDWLQRKGILKATSFLAIVMLVFAFVFALVGTLTVVPHEESSTAFVAILLAFVGIHSEVVGVTVRIELWHLRGPLSSYRCRFLWATKLWKILWISPVELFSSLVGGSSNCSARQQSLSHICPSFLWHSGIPSSVFGSTRFCVKKETIKSAGL